MSGSETDDDRDRDRDRDRDETRPRTRAARRRYDRRRAPRGSGPDLGSGRRDAQPAREGGPARRRAAAPRARGGRRRRELARRRPAPGPDRAGRRGPSRRVRRLAGGVGGDALDRRRGRGVRPDGRRRRRGLGRRAAARCSAALLARATEPERDFLARLVVGELRQGALEGVLVEALARAAGVAAADVRRAAMLAGDLAAGRGGARSSTARPASRGSRSGARARPADARRDRASTWARRSRSSARPRSSTSSTARACRCTSDGDDVRVFSRSLRDVTPAVPEIVEAVRALPDRALVLDGEALALRPDGTPEPFQVDDAPLRAEARRRRAPRASCRCRRSSSTRSTPAARTSSRGPRASGSPRSRPRVPEPLRVPRVVTADAARGRARSSPRRSRAGTRGSWRSRSRRRTRPAGAARAGSR